MPLKRSKRYSFIKLLKKPDRDRCTICLCAKRNPVRLRCGHSYCKRCMDKYRSARGWDAKKCPICRRAIVPPSFTSYLPSLWQSFLVRFSFFLTLTTLWLAILVSIMKIFD